MSDRTVPLAKGLIAALKADAGVSAITDKIYTKVPQGADFPYVKLRFAAEDAGTKDAFRQEFRVSVQCFARENGTESAVEIAADLMAACITALDRQEASVTMTAGTLVMLQYDGGQDLFVENDGKTYQSIAFFKAETE